MSDPTKPQKTQDRRQNTYLSPLVNRVFEEKVTKGNKSSYIADAVKEKMQRDGYLKM